MMPDKGIEFDLRALSIYEEALGELDSSTDDAIDDPFLVFAINVVRWYESHWIVSDDYSTFYPSKRFRRKDDFDYSSVVSELYDILDYYNAMVGYQLSKVGD